MKSSKPYLVPTASRPVLVEHQAEKPAVFIAKNIAILDGGLWPCLLNLPTGELLIMAFNQPKHSFVTGGQDIWRSRDEGETWERISTVFPPPDGVSNRVNHAVGYISRSGRLLALCSGSRRIGETGWEKILPAIAESCDGGSSWQSLGVLDAGFVLPKAVINYGIIREASDGTLRSAVYYGEQVPSPDNRSGCHIYRRSYMIRSRDAGRSWEQVGMIAGAVNETSILEVAPGEWLAAARTLAEEEIGTPERGRKLRQFRSTDDGVTWVDEGPLTDHRQHPAHLLRLADGRLLLCYGDRNEKKIFGRMSRDQGRSWGSPIMISSDWKGDGGYPCSTQLSNGDLLTVYYTRGSSLVGGEERYHVLSVRWQPPQE